MRLPAVSRSAARRGVAVRHGGRVWQRVIGAMARQVCLTG